ncbi:MAG: saccharopine dehydrogenase NADP-binding domain-containing protein [Acidobacteria bacterium]|uniref:Saccharopine dehydrogenase NADP-binding domain-containing protein n=1 Tax=Candidatus Polarisedimenticola svalbardensis TaxID=2886004 RepID=A0A8J6Y179_9BACT|nr:saccharopine dehydrogenase NADP-binding domain-containing protein [Candidatus Polarisedimenticola svalbardensis]
MTPSVRRHDREFDLILWGATGFTGQLVARHLAENYDWDVLRWAIGGRDEVKLAAVREGLGAPDLPVVLGDAHDQDKMAALAKRTRVVCSTVGPYARYGSELVAACVRAGTGYCDLTGEAHWIRRMLDAHNAQAVETGARIVPTCGFDSIPSDLGVYFLQREMQSRHGAPGPRIKGGVARLNGKASGGTVASMLNLLEEAGNDRSVRRILVNPYSLNPEGKRNGPDGRDRMSPSYDDDFRKWTAPFIMAGINTRIVRRSAALMPDLYGPDFSYQESMLTGRGVGGALKATAVSGVMAAALGALSIGPIRRLIAPRLPQPGEGPTPEEQKNGNWEMRFLGGSSGARVTGDMDPGYGSTSKMLAESAVCLALDQLTVGGGFHTPASAMGNILIERLQKNAGVTFEVIE